MLKSPRDPRESKFLVRVECAVLMAMFVMQIGILILSCAMRNCCVGDYEAEKGRRNFARVQEETVAEGKDKEMGEKMKYGKLTKNDFEA